MRGLRRRPTRWHALPMVPQRVRGDTALLTALLVALVAALAGVVVGPVAPAWAQSLVLQRPVAGEVLRGFDPPAQNWDAGHRGVDLAASAGTPVHAAAAGRVSHVGMIGVTPTISITHDEASRLRTTYQPVSAVVEVDEWVEAGQVIGLVQLRLPGQDHPGLHWGLIRGDTYLNPLAFLDEPEIRLLPAGSQPVSLTVVRAARPGLPTATGLSTRPADGPVTSPFGMRLHPVLRIDRLHDGVDLGAPCGSPVRSVSPGRVVLVERHVAYGIRVIVAHSSGLRTGYAHLSHSQVSVGDIVAAGQRLGSIGSTGWSTGCHLHLMAWQDGQLINPTRFV